MGPKRNPRESRGGQGKENWKRKRANNSTNDTPSRSGQFKKAKHSITESPQDVPAESSKLDDSNIPPPTDSASVPIIPSGDLAATYDITSINVLSATQIQKKVIQTLGLLSEYPTISPAKSKVVLLHAKAPVASKMITIAEIAKREIVKSGGKWFQYNMVEEVMVEQKEKKETLAKDTNEKENKDNEDDADPDVDADDETTAFETMKTPFERANEGKPRIRAVPVMTVYLSRMRIESLRKSYGEQTNALEAR